MKTNIQNEKWILLRGCTKGFLALFGVLLIASAAYAQVTNAFDEASDPAYGGDGAPNGLSTGGQNGGFGFSPWTFTVSGSGGSFIAGSGPSGNSFDLWNTSANSSTVAVRPFGSGLAVGQSFSVSILLNSLDTISNTNEFALEDSSGNILFGYWHYGSEANANNGEYSDATTNDGTAVNFQYAYQHFESFTFTLNSPTTYTFTDNSTGASFTGTIVSSSIAQAAFIRINGADSPGNGQDFQFDQLKIASSTPPTFGVMPVPGELSVATTNPIVAQVAAGSVGLDTSSASLYIDGSLVTPTIGGSSSLMTVSYLPSPALSAGSPHTVQLVVKDFNAAFYTNTWSFTTGFSSLPVLLQGPFMVNSNVDLTIFTAAGDPWVGTNYQNTSIKTLYARFSMNYIETNTTPSIYTFGGLDLFEGKTEQMLVGKSGALADWSTAAINGTPDTAIPPAIQVNTNEWHTFVLRIDYSAGQNATAQIWLDPDFSQTEASQPNAPLVVSLNATFDSMHLRSGFDNALAVFSNIVMAATSAGVGFVAPSSPQFESYIPSVNASAAPTNSQVGVTILFGTYGIATNSVTLNVDGNNITPAFITTTNSITLSFQPSAPFAAGSVHTATLSLTDSNGSPYSTSWSFTVDPYPSLPVTNAGPFTATSGNDVILWTSQNEWIGINYSANSTNTLYTRFSMTFYDINGETGSGGGFGGLEYFLGNTEQLMIGNNWLSTNWSVSVATQSTADIPPVTPILLGSWHTMVVKSVYTATTNTQVEVWLDPDFTKSEQNQPNSPLRLTCNSTFDNIHLRAGVGSADAEFTNVVIAATAQGVGFPAATSLLNIQNIGSGYKLSWTGAGTLLTAPTPSGPWTTFANQSNPQILSTTNAVRLFRLLQ